MNFQPDNFYHVYNQGNNRQTVFHQEAYYGIFMSIFKQNVLPHCTVVNYALMPNHFHFLIYCDDRFAGWDFSNLRELHPINEGFRVTLSHYARIVNNIEGRSGSLFRQNTKAKCLQDEVKLGALLRPRNSYLEECFLYIHQNPLKGGLVEDLACWPHSAYGEYAGLVKDGICDRKKAEQFCGYKAETFRERCHLLGVV